MQAQAMLYPSDTMDLSSDGDDIASNHSYPIQPPFTGIVEPLALISDPEDDPEQITDPSEAAESVASSIDSDTDVDDSDSNSSTSSDSKPDVPKSTSDKYFTHFSLEELRDLDSWKIQDPALQESMEWAIWKLEKSVSNAAFNSRPTHTVNMSFTRLMKKMISLTGLKPRRIPCCVKSCALYEDPSVTQCVHCDEELYENVNLLSGSVRRPRKNFFYFSPIPRLILNWAIPDVAREMRNYVSVMLDDNFNPGDLNRDFYNSNHYQRLRNEGYFQDIRTLALVHSADGASVVRQKNKSVWLFLLTVLNVPPEDRYRSMMITGLVPGEPRDLASFFQPLLRDLALLSTEGVDAIDGSLSTRPHFMLKAHLTIITGDFPAVSKMMDFKGANGYAPCRFCSITGIYHDVSRHTYYPLNGCQFSIDGGANDSTIGLQTHLRDEILLVNAARSKELKRLHGISGCSPFFNVPSMHFPESFGLDTMHLFTNVAKLFWSIWSGRLLPPSFEDEGAQSYVLTEAQMIEIGVAMEAAAKTVHVSVSRLPRSIHKHVNSFKATEWYSWIMIFSVPLLRDKLPDYALQHWVLFSEAVRLCVQVQLSANEIALIETKLRNFVETAESIYYQNLPHRLPVCTSQLHSLLHVAANLRDLGPSYVTWQFGLERYVGCLAPLATSMSQIDTSMCNGLERLENMRYLKPMYKLRQPEKKRFCDDLLNSQGEKYGALLGKGRKKTMTKRLNQTLNTWYSMEFGLSGCHSSQECIEWSKVQRLVTVGTAQEFLIATKSTGSGNARARNYVGFRKPDENGHGGLAYGQVISFFRHESPVSGSNSIYTWALIDCFVLICDTLTGCLYFERTENKAGSRLIDIHDIVAPIGLLRQTQGNGSWWIAQGYRILA